tara:strand:- start:252 stop:1475 length:1224 start_codon:yes stop_codon:yes gene_type:complete
MAETFYEKIPPLTVSQEDQNLLRVDANDAGMSENSFAARALVDAVWLQPGFEKHFAYNGKLPANSEEAYQNFKFKRADYVRDRVDLFSPELDYISDKKIIENLSNLQTKYTFIEPFLREATKQAGAITTSITTTAASTPLLAPLIVAFPQVAVPSYIAVAIGSYALGYTASDTALDAIAGEDPVVIPSESWKRASGETLGSFPFSFLPYSLPQKVNFMGNKLLNQIFKQVEVSKPTIATESMSNYYRLMENFNIKPTNKDIWGTAAEGKLSNLNGFGGGPVSLQINKAAENFLESIGTSYRVNPVPMLGAEALALGGGSLGAGGSESLFPGNVGMNLASEIGGSLGLEATITRLAPVFSSLTKKGITAGKSYLSSATDTDKRQIQAVQRIFEILQALRFYLQILKYI